MKKKTILAVDDEVHILELLKYNLETNGYTVITVETGEAALDLLSNEKIDAVLLDVMLPQIDGLEVLRRIRNTEKIKKIPVILLTAKSAEFDKVLGLEMGADDYIAKPFSIRELQARVKAVLRRISEKETIQSEQNFISTHGLEIGLENKIVKKDGVLIEMSLKEFELLKLLAESPGKVYSRDVLLEKIWSYDYKATLTVHKLFLLLFAYSPH